MIKHGVINSLEDYNCLIEEIRNRRKITQLHALPYRQEFYRGQLDSSWSIKPSLTRDLETVEQVILAEKKILTLFENEISEKKIQDKVFLHKVPINFQNEWSLLVQAQHYGIPTRMLDWTLKPEVALYFAVENPEFDHISSQFIVIFHSNTKVENNDITQYYDVDLKSISETMFINPSFYYTGQDSKMTLAETRRARQHGKFLIQSYQNSLLGIDEQVDYLKPWIETCETGETIIEKYIIPSSCKPQLRLDLISKGWHKDFLYSIDDFTINDIKDKCKQALAEFKN